MIGQRHAGFTVMLADKTALLPKAQLGETRIADNDLLETQQLVAVQWLTAGFADGAAPSLNTVLRRALAFDGVA
jgi:hypothetical protein